MRLAINGGGPFNSDRRRTRSSRSKRSSKAASNRRHPPPRAAAERSVAGGVPVRAFAPAKINLYLHVLGRRADGYHRLDSLVAFADIGDRITARRADSLTLTVGGPEAAAIAALDE